MDPSQPRRSRASSWWDYFTYPVTGIPPRTRYDSDPPISSSKRMHQRTPSVPPSIPSIKINTPSDPECSSEGDLRKKQKRGRLERSISAFGGYDYGAGTISPSEISIEEESPSTASGPSELELDKPVKWTTRLLHPKDILSSKPRRQRSKSYSDLYSKENEKPGLPELTLDEVKEIILRHKQNKQQLRKGQSTIPTPPPLPSPPTIGIVSGLIPATSLVSLDGRLLAGMKNLKPLNKGLDIGSASSLLEKQDTEDQLLGAGGQRVHFFDGSRASRPRKLSHPGYHISENIHTAPILGQQGHPHQYASALNFFRPYFRRASQFSTLSGDKQGLILAESMVSLTHRALVSFIIEDNFSGLQHLLESRRVAVDDRDENGSTALMVAASRGKIPFVRALLEHGAEINAEDVDNWTPLLFAAKEGHDDIVADLLDHGAKVNQRDMGGWTSLMWACYKGRIQTASLLVEKGADVNAYGSYSVSCLGWAAGRGYSEIVKELLVHGAKVNVGDKYGTTPLIWAARKGFIEIVDMLLNVEANVDACGMTSWTPLLVSSAGNHVECVKAILEHKPNVNALDKDGCSALTIACKEGFHEIAVSLINHGAYININDRGGTSNLIHAAKGGHRSIVEALLKKHADVNVQGKDRKTALYWAIEKSHVTVVKLLLSAHPDLELTTKDGDSPLMKAVRNRNTDIVSILLDKRAKVSVADKNGDTCLHIAMRARSKQIVELLLRNPAHSQLLYRPNRAGETPYNIDRTSPKPIIPQIFGSRGLNTQEDGENLLGYNLYSSALADMLSDPGLHMPITVGLYARWGSGKSFLLNKLRDEMKSFARQWLSPVFSWNFLILIVVICFASVVGVIAGLALQNWIVGAGFAAGITILVHTFLFFVWISSRRAKYDWSWSNRLSSYLATKSETLKLVCQVIFSHPPGALSAEMQAQPINFYFTEQTKISSTTGGENSVVQMLGSLYTCIENDYGVMSSRLFRAFRPKPVAATSDWKLRKLCCIPYCVIFLFSFFCALVAIVVLALHVTGMGPEGYTTSLSIVMYVCALTVGLLLVANVYTVGQVLKAVVFSHRTHLQRTVSKLYAVKAEGFLNALKGEVNLMTDMIHCLDAFTSRQTRMVVIVDGLDSAEQEKVLQVLDAVNILFSDVKAPFVILLAIDPHIIAKGIEMNINPVLNESNIGGHDYLRNLVHLPFFLQNAALRKVKHVKMLENSMKRNSRLEEDPGPTIVLSTRRPSVESGFGIPLMDPKFDKPSSKKPKRLGLRMSESIASSLGSNLNKVTSGLPIVGGPSDLKKMLLGDDYFSDVNPRSMRRLMNIIHITGRLLKCFSIDFNWYHLSAWVNVTEQWPYRLSWMIIYCEHFQKDLDDGMSLKTIYERVRPFIPTTKDVDVTVALDRDEKKLDIYLGMHKGSLLVSTLYVFLPFTISLDPQLRKDITEQYQPADVLFKSTSAIQLQQQTAAFLQPPFQQAGVMPSPNPSALRYRGNQIRPQGNPPLPQFLNGFPPQFYPGLGNVPIPMGIYQGPGGPIGWPYPFNQQGPPLPLPASAISSAISISDPLAADLKNRKLSTMSVEGVCDLLVALTGIKSSQLTKYQDTVRKNNITGRVLMNCDLAELKLVLQMTFGDWEMFKSAIVFLKDSDNRNTATTASSTTTTQEKQGDDNVLNNNVNVKINVTSPGSPTEKPPVAKSSGDAIDSKKPPIHTLRPNVLEKQVTMEEQMICGALELLNDEAKEDARKGEDTDELSPINSEPEPPDVRRSSKTCPQDETDVLYVVGSALNVTAELPDSPSVIRKLSEAEAKFSILNESISNPRFGTGTEPIAIPGGKSPRKSRPSSFSKNLSFSESVTMLSSSPTKVSRSLGTKEGRRDYEKRPSKSPGKERKVSRSFAAHLVEKQGHGYDHSSSDASSDESQKPLVMKHIPSSDGKHKKIPLIKAATTSSRQAESPKRKRVQRDDSKASTFSKIKSSLFGQSHEASNPNDQRSLVPGSSGGQKSKPEFRPVLQQQQYDFPPTEDSSEPSQYFNPSREHQGQPWTAYRAPTPLVPVGTDEYCQAIKSNNPSPTTSNESELGSTPEELSSKEELYLHGHPELPESPYATVMPRAQPSRSFIPVSKPTGSKSKKKTGGRFVASSGEEAVNRGLNRSQVHRSDPVLSASSSTKEHFIVNIESGGTEDAIPLKNLNTNGEVSKDKELEEEKDKESHT